MWSEVGDDDGNMSLCCGMKTKLSGLNDLVGRKMNGVYGGIRFGLRQGKTKGKDIFFNT